MDIATFGLQDYRTLRNEFTMSLKSPRASNVCGLGHELGTRSARGIEGRLFGRRNKVTPSFAWRKGLRSYSLRISDIPGLALCLGVMSRTGASLAMSIQPSGYHLTRPFAKGSASKSPVASSPRGLFLPMKPSKYMSDRIRNLVLISWLLVAAGHVVLAVTVAQLVSVLLGSPGEFVGTKGDGSVAIRPDYLTWEVYRTQGMPCILEVRKSSRSGPGVILLGRSTRRARTKREEP